MEKSRGADMGTGRRSPTGLKLLADGADGVARAATRPRSAGRRDHALADPYGGESRGRARLCAAFSAAGLLPRGRQKAGGCDDGPGADRTVSKPGQEVMGMFDRPGTSP